jgi:hypothetical protein
MSKREAEHVTYKMSDGTNILLRIQQTVYGKQKFVMFKCVVKSPEVLCASCGAPIADVMKPYAIKCIMLNDDNTLSDRTCIFHAHSIETIKRALDLAYYPDKSIAHTYSYSLRYSSRFRKSLKHKNDEKDRQESCCTVGTSDTIEEHKIKSHANSMTLKTVTHSINIKNSSKFRLNRTSIKGRR